MQKRTRNAILVVVVAGVLAAAYLLPLGQWALRLVEWVRGARGTGVLAYFLVYVSAVVSLRAWLPSACAIQIFSGPGCMVYA